MPGLAVAQVNEGGHLRHCALCLDSYKHLAITYSDEQATLPAHCDVQAVRYTKVAVPSAGGLLIHRGIVISACVDAQVVATHSRQQDDVELLALERIDGADAKPLRTCRVTSVFRLDLPTRFPRLSDAQLAQRFED